MAKEFNRNMFVMLVTIMIGIITITYFIADIQKRSQIETLTTEHISEIQDIHSVNENFTDNFLQGVVKMDAARETREVSNYYFDFALFWYNTALRNTTSITKQQCIDNCTYAMTNYLVAYESFDLSKPFFETAKTYTEKDRYIEVLGYYVAFAQCGKNITMLRYNASQYLKYAAENMTSGAYNENMTMWMELFNETENLYGGEKEDYDDLKGQIDEYLFFDEIREEH